jgi:hypothetical protein
MAMLHGESLHHARAKPVARDHNARPAIAGCASAPPALAPSPMADQADQADLGLSIRMSRLPFFPHVPQMLFFARLDANGEPITSFVYASNFHKEERACLINARPGDTPHWP